MLPTNLFDRLPPTTTLLLLAHIFTHASAHAVPRQTKTLAYRTLDVLPWPPLPTAAPLSPAEVKELLRRQEFNTVCGFIGGDPKIPATCGAGSHCVVDQALGAIGCCPNGGACTTGVFTGCVDFNSGPQTVVNPYVFSCQGSNVCYKNIFDGGLSQFGCGTASSLATSVATSVAALTTSLGFSSVSAQLTARPSTLSRPTTINPSTGTKTSTTSTSTRSSTTSTTSTSSSSTSSTSTSSPILQTQAPEETRKGNRIDDTGAIIGGTISGVAILIALIAVGFYVWRRKKGNTRHGPGKQNTAYISPMTQGAAFTPLPGGSDGFETFNRPYHPGGAPSASYTPVYGYGASSAGGVAATAAPPSVEADRVPLTREIDDFRTGYNSALENIREEDERLGNDTVIRSSNASGATEERPLWQQNRRQSRNMMWM